MGTGSPHPSPPTRIRRRLTAACALAAALGAGVVAVLGIALADEYRWRSFRERVADETRVALALAPADLDDTTFDAFRARYQATGDADVVARAADGRAFASSASPRLDDVPDAVRQVAPGEQAEADADVGGRDFAVAAAATPDGDRYWFFFASDEIQGSLRQLATASGIAFALAVAASGGIGWVVARRALRPVADAAAAAEAIRAGRHDARLPEGPDEFGAWAASFNRMADTVEATIDRLARAAERERRFTADVAHELRTPLTGMTASAALLTHATAGLGPEVRRPAELLATDVRRLRALVVDLLELSRLDAAVDDVHAEPLDLTASIAAAARGLGDAAPDGLTVDVPDGLRVVADPRRLDRILTNVLANAATHGAAPVIVTGRPHDRGTVRVTVVDHGPGIPPGDLDHVLDRFAKADRSRSAAGSGLGLAIAHAQAVAQGGTLTATNEPGAGARIDVVLPATDPPVPRPGPASSG